MTTDEITVRFVVTAAPQAIINIGDVGTFILFAATLRNVLESPVFSSVITVVNSLIPPRNPPYLHP